MNKFLSIIIPVYNAQDIILEFYENIKRIENAEFIFVNDGSLDDSYLILNEISSNDKRVKVIHQENKGPMHARNSGMNLACYDYISFIDIDDKIDENFFYNRALWDKADLIITSYFSEKNNQIVSKFKEGYYNSVEFLNLISMHGGWELWGKIYKRKVLNNILIPPEKLKAGEDAYIFVQCLINADKVLVLEDYYYYYYYDKSSISNQKDDIFIIDNYKACLYILDFLSNSEKLIASEVYSNFLILFFCNSVKKNFKSKKLINFKNLIRYFNCSRSFNSSLPKKKFFIFIFYFFILDCKV